MTTLKQSTTLRADTFETFDRAMLHYQNHWNEFAYDVLGVRLDSKQQEVLDAIQKNKRVSVQSGVARGKDYLSAVSSLCFLFTYIPSKVICTAPTERQVRAIMMAEIGRIFNNCKNSKLFGKLTKDGIFFDLDETWYLMGFKSSEYEPERWSGFHSPNLMVVVTEATGINQLTFDTIEGILQGNSRLVLIFNPNRPSGEAYKSSMSPLYKRFKLSSLDSPNVIAKKIVIPGQVDYEWIADKLKKPGWVQPINECEMDPTHLDFKFEGECYRPMELFRVKVLAEFPEEGDDTLIPLHWIEMAYARWKDAQLDPNFTYTYNLKLGADIAGMGRDSTIFTRRHDNYVQKMVYVSCIRDATIHMQVAGRILAELKNGGTAYIDTIGEGAGVHSRCVEMGLNTVSVKFSESAKGLKDVTGQRHFLNMRAYLFWALRDALNPAFGYNLMIPPMDELTEELTTIKYTYTSTGAIQIMDKDDIKKIIGRSCDNADSLVNTFYPAKISAQTQTNPITKDDLGLL
jgi:hypothetical protein